MRVATQTWRWPAALGLSAVALQWVVWYFTKSPCTIENALAGVCNAGPVARYIDHQILAQAILLGLAVAAVKGGYDEIMVSRERKRADDAEQRAAEIQERLRQERQRADEIIEELRAQLNAEQEANRAERQAFINTMGEISSTMAQIRSTMAQLLERQQNGRSSPEN